METKKPRKNAETHHMLFQRAGGEIRSEILKTFIMTESEISKAAWEIAFQIHS